MRARERDRESGKTSETQRETKRKAKIDKYHNRINIKGGKKGK